MKLGIELRIDVTKIDKSKIFPGKKGKYLTMTTFIDTEAEDKYGNHGFINHALSKEEREQNVKTEILGNAKIFYKKDSGPAEPRQNQAPQGAGYNPQAEPDDDMPF